MSETPGNLFGRAAPSQMGLDILPEPRVQEFTRPPGLTGSSCRQTLRRAGPIGVAARVAHVLATHGTGGPPQHRRHHPQGLALGQSQTQGLTLLNTHVRIAVRSHGNTLAQPGLVCCTWS